MNYYRQYLEKIGEKKFRISQIDQAIYKDLVEDWDDIKVLPKALREDLRQFDLLSIKLYKEFVSKKDGTVKVIFMTSDGLKLESVLMRHHNDRNTVCVSCQVGCAQGCSFCATGKMGLKRDLSADEIISQVIYFQRLLRKEGYKVTNVVFMGMGEPLLNYKQVMGAINMMHDQKKFGLSARHITVSTSGVIPGIEQFAKEPLQLNLAISIHAGTDETRSKIMPVNLAYPLDKLIQSIKSYQKISGRKIFYEYAMIKGVNDSLQEARSLGSLLKGHVAHVNIIPLNPADGSEQEAASTENMREFQKVLQLYGIPSTIRVSLGQDIKGACGQLKA